MSQPEQPPEPLFFVDRSLGRVTFPGLLREAGWNLVTLAEHYGVPQDQDVADTQWIEEATKQGWPILMKDKRIRYRPAEIRAVIEHKAKCFVVTRGDLTSTLYAERFNANRTAIIATALQNGPFIYAVHTDRIERMHPPRD